WGTMLFNHKDIMEHGSISEQNFLKLLPDTIEDFMDYMKNVVSVNFMKGASFAKVTADNAAVATGYITVDRPDLFVLGQKVIVDDDNSSPVTGYVTEIVLDLYQVRLCTARGGSTGVDFTNYTLAQNAKC